MANDEIEEFVKNYKSNKDDKKKLKILFRKTEDGIISSGIIENVDDKRDLGMKIWFDVISHIKDEEKLFEIVKEVLPKLNRDQLSTKTLNDFYSRLCIEIPRLSLETSIKIAHFCESSLQFGDPRASFFKDILPCILQFLAKEDRNVTIEGVTKSSSEHQQMIINNILSKPFKVSILSSITSMFKDIPLSKLQNEVLMGKICENLQNVHQSDIPRLSLACFNLALFNKLIIPVLALDSYFFIKRYMKKFVELESEQDMDSIDETSERGIIETEENVIFHFQQVTEFTSIEKDIVVSLKPLAFVPKLIISPFIATILVSFAKMSSSSSVAGNLRLPQSILLPFMKQVFKNNEKHRKIQRQSAWARSVDENEFVDIEKLLRVIQENTCKLGQNAALNGFIGLTFMLLKTKDAPNLNKFAVSFLNELVKQRPEFSTDIVKIIVKMLFSEPNKGPIIECFTQIIQRKSMSTDRYEEAMTELIENLTELEYDTAMALESALHLTLLRSTKLRDLMSKTMRKAMYQNSPEMRKLAIHSFCVMLKYVKKPRAGSMHEIFGASQNLSMMSLMSQSQLPSTGEMNMRRVSVMVLEILGILRKCFSHKAEFRVMLYESLLGAITTNEFVIPNVIELVEPNFRDYFDNENPEIVINFENVFKKSDNDEDFVVMDHLGKFLLFFIRCLEVAKCKKDFDFDCLQFDTYFKIINNLIEKIFDLTMEQLGIFSVMDFKSSVIVTQTLNCIEALMTYCCENLTARGNVEKLLKLFSKHQFIIREALKIQENSKKSKKGKNVTEIGAKKIEFNFECVWNFRTCVGFTRIIFESNDDVKEVKQNKEFVRFVLKSLNQKIQKLLTSTESLNNRNSKSTFAVLKEASILLYKQMQPQEFKVLYEVFDAESANYLSEAFKNSLACVNLTYPSKFKEFLQAVTKKNESTDTCINRIMKINQELVDWSFDPDSDENMPMDANGEKIIGNLFSIIEILFKSYENIRGPNVCDCYKWILKFCTSNEIPRNLQSINGILIECMSQDSGSNFVESAVYKISSLFGHLNEAESQESPPVNIQSFNQSNLDFTFNCIAAAIKRQIEEIEFFILRMNSLNSHIKMPGQTSRNESIKSVTSLEISVVIRLKVIGKIIRILGNSRFNVKNNQIETFGKIVINYFNCLKNLIRHFIQHFDVKNLDYRQIPLESLMKETKITVKGVYALSPYIDDMFEKENQGKDAKKKKIVKKEFKYNSRLVLAVEQFAASVGKFDSVTKKNFGKYLHSGEVRDFRIKSGIENPQQNDEEESDNTEIEDEVEEEVDSDASKLAEIDDEESEEEEIQVTRKTSKTSVKSRKIISSSSENENSDVEEVAPVPAKRKIFGIRKSNENVKKRVKK